MVLRWLGSHHERKAAKTERWYSKLGLGYGLVRVRYGPGRRERYQEMRGDYSLSFNLLLRARRRQWNSTPRDIEVTCEAHLEPQAGLVLLGGFLTYWERAIQMLET
jgi:hypothetical protein